MRRLTRHLTLPACALALAVAGCGGGDDDAASPLDDALGYLPEDAPFAVAIDTDVDGDQFRALGDLAERFPGGSAATDQFEESIEEQLDGGSYEKDIKPLLGNPFVVGATDARSFTEQGDTEQFVGAVKSKDGDKLEELLKKGDVKEEGEASGAKLYEDEDGDTFAIKDDVLVVAGSRRMLEDALERREGDDRLEEDTFEEALDGLAEDALVRVYFDVQALLRADPDTRDARKVKWVRALTTFGMTAAAGSDSIDLAFNLKTDGEDLSEEDLPIAGGDEAPGVVQRPGELNFGLRDPSQIVDFAEAAGQAVDPSSFGDYENGKKQIEDRLGVSLDEDVFAQLTGDVSVNATVDGKFGVRAELDDPQEFERTLEKIADTLPDVAEGAGVPGPLALAKPKRGDDFYALAQPDGDSIVFGVVGDVFVLANEPARAGLATESPDSVSGAEGSVVIEADAERLVQQVLRQIGPQLGLGGGFGGQLFTGPLGDLVGSMQSSTDGIRGKVTLGIER